MPERAASCRTIGLVGHNLITLAQAKRLRAALPATLAAIGQHDEAWRLLTPLAPGADYVLTNTAWSLLRSPRSPARNVELHVCQHVPVDVLASAWIDQGGLEASTPDGALTAEALRSLSKEQVHARIVTLIEALLAQSTRVTDGQPAYDGALRAALARNDAYLLAHADDLIVALDSSRFGTTPTAWREIAQADLPPLGVAHLARAWLAREGARADRLHLIDLCEVPRGKGARWP